MLISGNGLQLVLTIKPMWWVHEQLSLAGGKTLGWCVAIGCGKVRDQSLIVFGGRLSALPSAVSISYHQELLAVVTPLTKFYYSCCCSTTICSQPTITLKKPHMAYMSCCNTVSHWYQFIVQLTDTTKHTPLLLLKQPLLSAVDKAKIFL